MIKLQLVSLIASLALFSSTLQAASTSEHNNAVPLPTATDDISRQLTTIKLPPGFNITLFAGPTTPNGAALEGVRMMALDAKGQLYVSNAKKHQVLLLPDTNQDGMVDRVDIVSDQLNAPQGLAFVDNTLLVANQDGIVRLEQAAGQWSEPKPFITGLPTGGHTLKNIRLGPDGFLYVNVGSSCNVCLESDPQRATLLRFTKAGKPAGALNTLGRHQQSAIWASGLRNSQGFAWHPKTGAMYATNNGSDNRSDIKNGAVKEHLPPEHLNQIVPGQHYGWPYCWGNRVQDPNFQGATDFCSNTQAPALTFLSHTTPIGISFLDKTNWPIEYQSDALVALHGSWNRQHPAGYQLVRIKFKNNVPLASEDFATGWLTGSQVWGRPVDVLVAKDGAVYVSDDKAGAIYRISYHKN